jgi:hypothetical protein
LRSKATEIAARIANFSVEHIRVVDPCTDYRPAHRAQHVRDFVVGYGHNDQMIADKRLTVLAVRHAGGLSDRQIAQAIRARPTRVNGWLTGRGILTDLQAERLLELSMIVERLARLLDAASIPLWLDTPVPALGGEKPIDRIAVGDDRAVAQLISGLEDPGAS